MLTFKLSGHLGIKLLADESSVMFLSQRTVDERIKASAPSERQELHESGPKPGP
jgi:hypothetical protein